MKDKLLKGAIATDFAVRDALTGAIRRVRSVVSNRENQVGAERAASVVETVFIIAGLVLACVIVIGIIVEAVTNQAEKVGECIENANSGSCRDFNN